MSKKYRLITFCCYECGSVVKVLIRKDGSLIFSIIGKNHFSQDVLTKSGYYKCIECNKESRIKFEYIYG